MPVASQTTFSQGRRRSCFAIDANEPKVETADSIKFHWGDDRSGVKKIEALLGLEPMHRARDLFREWFTDSGGKPASAEVLLATYAQVRLSNGGSIPCGPHQISNSSISRL